MPQCPRCKGDMPLLSKICPTCQYVMEGGESTPSAEEMVNSLERILLDIKNLQKPAFVDSLREMIYIVVPIVAIYFLVLALISGAGMFWILGGVGGLMSIYTTIQKVLLTMKPAPKVFDLLKNQYEYYENIARRNFGKNPEVWRHISTITAEISTIESEHYAAKRHNLYLWGVMGVVFLVLATGGAITTSLVTEKEPEVVVAPWQEKINAFKDSSDNSEFSDNSARIEVLNEVLKNKEYEAAESFFFDYCQGKMGDVECAKTIMRAYMAASKTDKAMGFANRVVLRYASDAIKLKKILNDNGTVQ